MKAKVSLSIGYPAAIRTDEIEIDEEEWEACMSENFREELLNEYWQEWANNFIEGDISIIKEDI